jgi:hypothetical protein
MKNTPKTGQSARDLAAARLARIDHLSGRISDTLEMMIDAWDTTAGTIPKPILDKLNLLHAAHLKVIAAEDAFHDKFGQDPDADAIDYDTIRSELGGRLDRIRAALLAEGISGAAETGPDSGAALPVRLLGDAAPKGT